MTRASAANSIERFKTRSFYIDYRLALGYATDHSETKAVEFQSLEDWLKKKGTKLDACANICKYLLTHKAPPDVVFSESGVMTFPSAEACLEEAMQSNTTRILIYQEFKSQGPLLQKVSMTFTSFLISN
jgi:hypothetical protein